MVPPVFYSSKRNTQTPLTRETQSIISRLSSKVVSSTLRGLSLTNHSLAISLLAFITCLYQRFINFIIGISPHNNKVRFYYKIFKRANTAPTNASVPFEQVAEQTFVRLRQPGHLVVN